jgi:glycosyltransferase involved in cell wall biosynthesis
MTISIVVPVHNDAEHLKCCLDSISAQSSSPDEVIVVDNNCSDDSVKVAGEYGFVTLLKEPKQGVVFARNRGFNAASGDIVARIDADTILPPDWLARVTRHFEASENPISGSSYFYDLGKFGVFSGWLQARVPFAINRLLLGQPIMWGSNCAFLRSDWLKVAGRTSARTNIHEDIDLTILFGRLGRRTVFDYGLKVGIDSRLLSDSRRGRDQQMKYLKMWPRTLSNRRLKTAWLGWVGVYVVYLSYVPLLIMYKLIGLFDKDRPSYEK